MLNKMLQEVTLSSLYSRTIQLLVATSIGNKASNRYNQLYSRMIFKIMFFNRVNKCVENVFQKIHKTVQH